MKRRINPLLLIGIIGTCTIGSQLAVHVARAYWGDRDIWWTPVKMAVPFEQTKNEFCILIKGKPLADYLDAGGLAVKEQDGTQQPVAATDLTARLNNWPRTKSSILSFALFSAFGSGVALTCLAIGLIQAIAARSR